MVRLVIGVDALEGLVEEEDPRAVNERGAERELLLHAEAVVGDQRARAGLEIERLEELLRRAVDHRVVEPVHAPHEAQVLRAGEHLEQRHVLGHHANQPSSRERSVRESRPSREMPSWGRAGR